MSYQLPSQGGKWKVGVDGFADITRTRNMDFDETGVAKLAQQAIALYTTTEDSDFGFVKSIVNDYIITSGNVFFLNTTTGVVTEQTTTSMPDILLSASDAVYYIEIAVSAATTVTSYNGTSTWTSRITGLNSGVPHPMCVFENRNTLCVGNGNSIYQTNNGLWTQDSTNTLTIPSQYTITWMRWRQNNLYIGTRNTTGGPAKLFIWNGSGITAQQGYTAGCDWIYSGADYKDSMVVVASSGQILRFNGGGFDELAHFPVYETYYSWSKSDASADATDGRVPNRGMLTSGNILYINIDGFVQGVSEQKYLHEQPSGLWVFDPAVGLYHKSGYLYNKYNSLTVTNLSSNTLTVGTHMCETGDQIRATSVSNITGLQVNHDYYAIKISSTTLQLALSAADAFAGYAINLSGTPSGDTIATNRSGHGAVSTVIPGAIAALTNTATFTSFFTSELLFTGAVQDNAGNQIKSLMSLGVGRNIGHFITSQFDAKNVLDIFQEIYLFCKSLVLNTDSVVIKYRKTEKFGLPTPFRNAGTGIGTWIDSSTINVLSTAKDVKSASIGDEIEIIEGAGAGYTAHITNIITSTTTSTFSLDETIPDVNSGDTAEIIIDNWIKITKADNTRESLLDDYIHELVEPKGAWCQFKIELRGREVPINKTSIVTNPDL